jgi:hypothetical protein
MRVLLLMAALGILSAAPAGDFDGRVLRFQRDWNKFLRSFWGCTLDDAKRATCKPERGWIDRKQYEAARNAAADLFEFKGK